MKILSGLAGWDKLHLIFKMLKMQDTTFLEVN